MTAFCLSPHTTSAPSEDPEEKRRRLLVEGSPVISLPCLARPNHAMPCRTALSKALGLPRASIHRIVGTRRLGRRHIAQRFEVFTWDLRGCQP